MGKVMVFNSISVDGYFTDANSDMSWAHTQKPDAEWEEFSSKNAQGGGVLVFGRITYEMMQSYWPTAQAHKNNPAFADSMNNSKKVVFSRTLDKVTWKNTTLLKEDPAAQVEKLKQEADLVILGSGTIVAQLTEARLIDEYQLVLIPLVLGDGRTLFEGLEKKLPLKLEDSRSFKNGNVFLRYVRA